MAELLRPATTVTEAFNQVNPYVPLPSHDPRHVDFSEWRGDEPIATLVANQIRMASTEPGRYIKQLVAGHRGSGKTTELLRLRDTLTEAGFEVVYFDADDELDLQDVDYADLLLATISQVAQQAARAGYTVSAPNIAQLRARLDPIIHDVVAETHQTQEAEAGVTIPDILPFFAKLRAAFKNDRIRRETVRTQIRQSPTLFLEDLNDIIDGLQTQVQRAGKAGMVVIVDSLDRVLPRPLADGRTTHSELFVTHADQLKSPHCHMVFTMPISLAYDENLGTSYTMPIVQPMVRVTERDGRHCDPAIGAMVEAVSRRVQLDLFERLEDVRDLVLFSGGHIRDLMQLLTKACSYATGDRFTTQNVDQAKRSLTRDYDRLVRDADLPKLVQVHRDKRLPSDVEFSLLPYHLIVLEYQNGERWADVHPAVQATRKFREAWDARDTPLAADA